MNQIGKLLKRTGKKILDDVKMIRLPLALLFFYGALTQRFFHTVCPWAILTHLPCPACGLTRAGLCVCTFRFREALRLNAMIFFWMAYILYAVVVHYVLQWDKGRKGCLLAPAAVLALATICYFVWRILNAGLPADLLPAGLLPAPIFSTFGG